MTRLATGRIVLTLLLSLAVHGIIIALWPTTELVQLPKPGGHAITVSLQVQADKQSSKQDRPADKKTDSKTHKTRPVQTRQKILPLPESEKNTLPVSLVAQTESIANAAIQKPVPSIGIVKTEPSSLPDTETRNSQRLERLLRKAFNARFYYPRLAIRRGWQGEVRLGLRIEADGHLTKIRILHGSGYGLLDKAAMKSLNKVEVLPEAIALLDGRILDLILPVKYRLL